MKLFLGLISLLTGAFGKYFIYGGIALTVFLSVVAWVHEKENAAAQAALAQFNAAQAQQAQADNAKAQAQLKEVIANETVLQTAVDEANAKAIAANKNLQNWLDKQTKQSCKLNPVYNETLKRLKNAR